MKGVKCIKSSRGMYTSAHTQTPSPENPSLHEPEASCRGNKGSAGGIGSRGSRGSRCGRIVRVIRGNTGVRLVFKCVLE